MIFFLKAFLKNIPVTFRDVYIPKYNMNIFLLILLKKIYMTLNLYVEMFFHCQFKQYYKFHVAIHNSEYK